MLTVLLLIPAAYLWHQYIKRKDELEEEFSKAEDHYERLNCVVTYSKIHGIHGWPGFRESPANLTCSNIEDAFLPLLYFFNDTKVSLDIAIMSITSTVIASTLVSLVKKGIKVRLLVDYDHMVQGHVLKQLIECGAELIIYVGTSNSGSIFHYKYAIKDVNTDSSGLYSGSLNWSNAAFLENYENMVFTTNTEVINKFYENYVKCVDCVKQLAEDDLYVKVKLKELYAALRVI